MERATGLSRPAATVLARRGLSTRSEVERFLAADETHDPFEFEGMAGTVESVLRTIREGARITVYGDFDCDGVCATAVLVAGIRELGGQCDWFIPDRIADGYGLNPESIRQIADRGTSLVITVDCGVTAVEEVALARDLGMEIVITDHHQSGPELPDCPILHPEVSAYPFPSLCGTAVAAKLASAMRREAGAEGGRDEADLDLVALATVADVMPLVGENRHLVSEGIKVARRARRVGLAALLADARVEASRLSAEDFGFRVGPRINAAGRLYRADAGVELFLAESKDRAAEIARELAGVNAERRRVEQEVEKEAKAELRSLGEPDAAVVVAGEGWHPGVVGIVASKLVRATGRPSVVISLDGELGRGSARSVPGLDLHAALGDTADLLESFGGHAAAAGLSIRSERIEEFRQALRDAVRRRIGSDPVEPVIEFDAVAGGQDLGLDLAEQFEKLAPFGNGNPSISILIPGARIEDLQEMGEGKHCRFAVCSGSHRAKAVAFGRTSFGLAEGERADVIAELGVNHWNGSIEPQLRVREVAAVDEADSLPACGGAEWWERFEAAMNLVHERTVDVVAAEVALASGPAGLPGVGLAELISSGERLIVLTADARRRWKAIGGASLARFAPDPEVTIAGVWAGSPLAAASDAGEAQVLVTDFASLTGLVGSSLVGTGSGLDGFDRIALLDPPFTAGSVAWLARFGRPAHLLAGSDEFSFAEQVAGHRLDLTNQLRALFRGFREAGAIDGVALSGEGLHGLLARDGSELRSPEEAANLLRVLIETGLARSEGVGSARGAGVVSSERTELSASAVFVHHFELHKEKERFLSQFNRQTQKP